MIHIKTPCEMEDKILMERLKISGEIEGRLSLYCLDA
jgi:hypothetical protein